MSERGKKTACDVSAWINDDDGPPTKKERKKERRRKFSGRTFGVGREEKDHKDDDHQHHLTLACFRSYKVP